MCRLPLLLRSRGTKAYRATPGISPGHPGRACFEIHKAVPLPDIFLAPPKEGHPFDRHISWGLPGFTLVFPAAREAQRRYPFVFA